jgi:anti-sigma factor ChrR (cupin superfamily)
MTDERNIAHDKKIADDRHALGVTSPNDAVQAQPGRKPPQVDGDTDPSNSRASEMYKAGETPRDHSHEGSEHPAGDVAPASTESGID